MYIVFILQCQKKSENLSDLNKKDRNKRHSSPFINVVKGVFFVVRVTLVPVSYLSAPSAVHSYRVPGKFIRRLNSLFVGWKVFCIVRIKQKKFRIAYLYSKCTDCKINCSIGLNYDVDHVNQIIRYYPDSMLICPCVVKYWFLSCLSCFYWLKHFQDIT